MKNNEVPKAFRDIFITEMSHEEKQYSKAVDWIERKQKELATKLIVGEIRHKIIEPKVRSKYFDDMFWGDLSLSDLGHEHVPSAFKDLFD